MDKVFRQYFDWDIIQKYLPDLARGFWVTLQIALIAWAIALSLGLLLALARRSRPRSGSRVLRLASAPLRGLARAYIDVFRGVPALIVLLLLYGTFPQLPIAGVKDLTEFQIAFIALGLVYAAYIAEVYRAGIESVDRGQAEAARSLGMSDRQTMRLVVLPQAVKRVLPPLMNDFVALTKDTSLAGILAVGDVVSVARDAQSVNLNGSALVGAAGFFLVFTLPMIWLLDHIIAREQRKTGRGPTVMTP